MNSYVFILKLRTNLVLLFVSGPLFYGDEYLSVCICTICLQCSERPEKGVGSPGIEVTDVCELSRRCWESNPGPQQGQPGLLHSDVSCLPGFLVF